MVDIKERLQSILASLDGLSLEVEGMRMHIGSTGSFIQDELRRLRTVIDDLERKINAQPD